MLQVRIYVPSELHSHATQVWGCAAEPELPPIYFQSQPDPPPKKPHIDHN